jgi:hypothetical protein
MSASNILTFRPHRSHNKHSHPADVLSFPVQHECPTCHRACAPDDLSECLTCGQKYCSRRGCDWTCACDRFAADVIQRGMEQLARQ